MKKYEKFIDLKYKPKSDELITQFYINPKKRLSLKEVASNVAGESSVGTWTDVKTMKPRIGKLLSPKVFYLNEKKKIAKIAYPLHLFELGNLPEILSSVAGNIILNLSSGDTLELMATPTGGAINILADQAWLAINPLNKDVLAPHVTINSPENISPLFSTITQQDHINTWINLCPHSHKFTASTIPHIHTAWPYPEIIVSLTHDYIANTAMYFIKFCSEIVCAQSEDFRMISNNFKRI